MKQLKTKIKAILFLIISILPSTMQSEENQEAELIWAGNGSYVYRNPSNGKVTNADLDRLNLYLWQTGNEKYFTAGNDSDIHYSDFNKNPEYSKGGLNGFLSNFEYIIETEKYGKIYTNPDLNGNPLDYYSNEKKRRLGIVYPVTAQGFKKNSERQYVFDGKTEKIVLVLHRIGDTDNYYATYEGKRYEITEGPDIKVKRYVKVKEEPKYYQITYKGIPYAFEFEKL